MKGKEQTLHDDPDSVDTDQRAANLGYGIGLTVAGIIALPLCLILNLLIAWRVGRGVMQHHSPLSKG